MGLCEALGIEDDPTFLVFGIVPKRTDRRQNGGRWFKLNGRGRTSRLNVLYKALVKMCPGTSQYGWRNE